MKAIIGLGNPGPRYRSTRHNAGWHVLDLLAERWRAGKPERTRHAELRRCTVDGETVLLVKPLTFMNESGLAVRALVEQEGLSPDRLLVIYDDLDLAPGRIRVRAQGSSGGHRGIRSIQQQLAQVVRRPEQPAGPDGRPASEKVGEKAGEPVPFPRIKVGIGRPPPGVDPIDYVLASFIPEELEVIRPAIALAADAAECWVREGIEAAMNRFNGVAAPPRPAASPDRPLITTSASP